MRQSLKPVNCLKSGILPFSPPLEILACGWICKEVHANIIILMFLPDNGRECSHQDDLTWLQDKDTLEQ